MASKSLQKLRLLQGLAEVQFLFGCSPEPNAAICAQGVLPFKKPVAKKSRSNPYRRM
jgi:hypothetical protein